MMNMTGIDQWKGEMCLIKGILSYTKPEAYSFYADIIKIRRTNPCKKNLHLLKK
jgi:hypothetical protein